MKAVADNVIVFRKSPISVKISANKAKKKKKKKKRKEKKKTGNS